MKNVVRSVVVAVASVVVVACSSPAGSGEGTAASSEPLSCEASGANAEPACAAAPMRASSCEQYDPECSAVPQTWAQVVPNGVIMDPDAGPILALEREFVDVLEEDGCRSPYSYSPLATIKWPIAICPNEAITRALTIATQIPLTAYTIDCDRCTGSAPEGWSIFTWDSTPGAEPSGCHGRSCVHN